MVISPSFGVVLTAKRHAGWNWRSDLGFRSTRLAIPRERNPWDSNDFGSKQRD